MSNDIKKLMEAIDAFEAEAVEEAHTTVEELDENRGVRDATNRVLEMVEEGLLDKDTVIMACLKYMSEDDVADMAHINEFFMDDEHDDY